MAKLEKYLDKYLFSEKKRPTSERSHLIQLLCDDIFTNSDFQKLLGQTKQLTAGEIRSIYDEAKSWKTNPQALFWKLLKEKKEEIQKKIKEAEKDI